MYVRTYTYIQLYVRTWNLQICTCTYRGSRSLQNIVAISTGYLLIRVECNVKIGYLVQGLVAKVKDTVANGYFDKCVGNPCT